MTSSNARDADTSVIVTCYNERDYVVDALKSILDQSATGRIREVIVVDDGSSDGSADVISKFACQDSRIQLVRSTNVGLPSARNLALERVTGSYVAILDGDDLWLDNKLELQLPIFDKYPSVGLVYSDYYEFDDGKPDDLERCYARSYCHGHKDLLAEYYVFDAPVIPSCMVARKVVFDEVGLFNSDMRVGEDTEMFLRIAEHYEFHHIAEPLIKKRRHPRSISSRQDRLWPNHLRVSEQYAERNPSLRPLVRRRLSRRAAKVGWGMILVGERRHAASYLLRSMRYDPRQLRTYIYAVLACAPRPVALYVHRLLSEVRGRTKVNPVG